MAATIRVGNKGIEAETPRELFAAPFVGPDHVWAVTGDGQRFLIEEPAAPASAPRSNAPLTVEVNWRKRLKK